MQETTRVNGRTLAMFLAGACAGYAFSGIMNAREDYLNREAEGVEHFGRGLTGVQAAVNFAKSNGAYIGSLSWSNAVLPTLSEVEQMRAAVSNQLSTLNYLMRKDAR